MTEPMTDSLVAPEQARRMRHGLFYLLRFGFRLVPMREAQRDWLRQWFLDRFSQLVPVPPKGQVPPAPLRRARHRAGAPALGYRPRRIAPLPAPSPATLVAFYLPQFHTIPENDAWWGPGFTEWRNVSRALPQFEAHAQPRLPGELGFYDLRMREPLQRQVELAREYGIGAFCFYFYWFNGKRLLETPLQAWLADPSLDLPFCLCWANESWSRRWDGRADDILIAQDHGPEDDLAFIAHVARYLRDPRYLRVEGKPLLLIYRPGLLPDAKTTAARWREYCQQQGIGDIFLAYVQSFERPDPADLGFDAAVEFPPNLETPTALSQSQSLINPEFSGAVLDWRELARTVAQRELPAYPLFPGVNTGWDNEPRRPGAGRVYLHASPRGYRDWLQRTIQTRLAQVPAARKLVFINAWNEWAEGAVLEPDARLGHAWLDATRQALQRASSGPTAVDIPAASPCAVIHAWYLDVFDEILDAIQASGIRWRLVVTTVAAHADAVRSRLARLDLASELEVVENRGRDILPFLRVADRLLDEGVDLVLKLHTKRSLHRPDGDVWRRDLVSRLLAAGRATKILEAFAKDRGLGLVAPEGHLQPLDEHSGDNSDALGYLFTRLGIAGPGVAECSFVGGSMFWVRLEALRPLLDAHLEEWLFEPETGQLDGTLAHAIERVFALSVAHSAFRIDTAATICGEAAQLGPSFYDMPQRP